MNELLRPGKKQASETNHCVCVCESAHVCVQTCHSLSWLKVRVGAVASSGESVGETSAFGRCHQAPVHREQPDAPTGVPASPPRHAHTHTHTLQVSLRVTDNLSISIKKPNSVIARISPLVEVCVRLKGFFRLAMDSQRKGY